MHRCYQRSTVPNENFGKAFRSIDGHDNGIRHVILHETWHKLPSGPSAVTNRKKDHRQNNYAGKDAFNGRHPLKSYQNDSNLAKHDLIMHRSLSDLLDCNSNDVHDQEFVWL